MIPGLITSAINDEVETILFFREELPHLASETAAAIRIGHIDHSESILKSFTKKAETFYTPCVFAHMSPEQFFEEYLDWYYGTVQSLYENQKDLQSFYSYEDAAQDLIAYVPRILSKYDPENCRSIKVFMRNRLRWYLSRVLKTQIEQELARLEYTLPQCIEFGSRKVF